MLPNCHPPFACRKSSGDAARLTYRPTCLAAAGGFDSLSAVELSNKIGQAVGLDLPSTLVFDYPSVGAISAYLMTKIAPKQAASSAAAVTHITDITLPTAAPTALAAAAAGDVMIHMSVAARVPTPAFEDAGRPPAAGHDAISVVPYDRWGLEAPRVSFGLPACMPARLPAPSRRPVCPQPQPSPCSWPLIPPAPPSQTATPAVPGCPRCSQDGKSALKARFGGWLRGVDRFDASLFSLTSNEVELMDPQQRLLLEMSWEAIQTGHQQLLLAGERARAGLHMHGAAPTALQRMPGCLLG